MRKGSKRDEKKTRKSWWSMLVFAALLSACGLGLAGRDDDDDDDDFDFKTTVVADQ